MVPFFGINRLYNIINQTAAAFKATYQQLQPIT